MSVVACEVPVGSALDPVSVRTAFFKDAYRARLLRPEGSMSDLFFAIFGHHPWWIKAPLLVRNTAAKAFGLAVPTAQRILNPVRAAEYKAGDTIGPWPVFHSSPTELIAGRDNKHLDFRLSILRSGPPGASVVVVSTICNTHNFAGRAYLRAIIPFHVLGVKWLLANAIKEGRI